LQEKSMSRAANANIENLNFFISIIY